MIETNISGEKLTLIFRTGKKGETGETGATGSQGPQGLKGEKGDKGDKGDQGIQGAQGIQGNQGIQGIQGEKGDDGDQGPQGIQGLQGVQGPKGDKGDKGDTGANGAAGAKGETGDIGPRGLQGVQGPKGDTGAKGDTGLQGIQGEKGEKGDKGAKGDKGDQGVQGATGITGPKGEKGDKGDTGEVSVDLQSLADQVESNALAVSQDKITTGNDVVATNNNKATTLGYVNAASASAAAAAVSENNAAAYGAGTQIAQPETVPNAAVKIYVAAEAGVYTNFSGIVVTATDIQNGSVELRFYNGVWNKFIRSAPLAAYTPIEKFSQVSSEVAGSVTDILGTLTNGFINNNGSFTSSANWRTAALRPVVQYDKINYSGVRPTGTGAALIGLDASQANPVVLIPGTPAGIEGLYSGEVIINSVIKFVTASFRQTGSDTTVLTKTKPNDVFIRKDKVVGLDQQLDTISADVILAKQAADNAQADVDALSNDEVISVTAGAALQNGFLNDTGAFVASANFRSVLLVPCTAGQVFTYTGVRPDSTGPAAAVVAFDANGLNPVILVAKTTTGFAQVTQQFTIPPGKALFSACSRMLAGDVFNVTYTLLKIKYDFIPNSDYLQALSVVKKSFMPAFGYARQGEEFRMNPCGIVAMHPKDRSLDLVWNTNNSNEDFGSFSPGVLDNDVPIVLKQRTGKGNLLTVGTTVVRVTHGIQSPAAAVNVFVIGDSLIEQFNAGIANEFSRRLTGVGANIDSPGPAALSLNNIYFRGTLGTAAVKAEGRPGWGINDYLYNLNVGGYTNAFYNPSAGTIKFDLNYYLTQNNFQSSQIANGVDSTGSNMVLYFMLGWNHVYNTTVSQAGAWLRLLLDTIHVSHSGAKIRLIGLNTPPEKIYKGNYTINSRDVSPESIMRDVIKYAEEWQAVANERSSYVEFLPVAPFFQPDGAYATTSKTIGIRGGSTFSYATDYVHPIAKGYAQIADILFMNFIYHYCRTS